jgi:hypothetical protein
MTSLPVGPSTRKELLRLGATAGASPECFGVGCLDALPLKSSWVKGIMVDTD